MIRLIGSILIVAGSVACGIRGVIFLRERVTCLASLVTALDVMKSEICCRLTPIPELVEMLEKQAPRPANFLFANASAMLREIGDRPFPDIWRDAVTNTPQLLLTSQELLCLGELGYFVGKYDAGQQEGALENVRKNMESFLQEAKNQKQRNSRLCAFMGFASGMLAVIVLL